MTRVVVVGSGSAGRRHARAIRARLPDCAITVVRRGAPQELHADLAHLDVSVTDSVDAATSPAPDLGIVANPAPMHGDAVSALLDSRCAVLVEKPLTADLDEALRLAGVVRASHAPLVVGYHLRFAETAQALARLVSDGRVGTPRSFRFEVGQHLADWRPGSDPRRSVSARAELGGGVLLELSHELDAVRFVLGEVATVDATLRTDGAPTDGVVETVADLDVTLWDGTMGSVHLDMTSRPPVRAWRVRGDRGVLIADLLPGRVELHQDGRREVVHRSTPGERDRAEQALLDHLLEVAAGTATPRCTVDDGVAALEIVDAARLSAARGATVDLGARRDVMGR